MHARHQGHPLPIQRVPFEHLQIEVVGRAGVVGDLLPVSGRYTARQKECLEHLTTAMRLTREQLMPGRVGKGALIETVAGRCKEVESGARNVDHILTGTLLPDLAREVLSRMAEGQPISAVHVGVDGSGQFTYQLT